MDEEGEINNMLLKKISIKNYRQFKETEIDFDNNLTVLAGANNSGKTSIIELFKRLFKDKNFSQEDVSADYYDEIKKDFANSITSIYNDSENEIEFREKVKQLYDTETRPIGIKTEIEVQYEKSESIALFSDYLMELDENCTSFYFTFNYEINLTDLTKEISTQTNRIYELRKTINESSDAELISEKSNEYQELVYKIFDSSFVNAVYFTDKNYKNEVNIGVREFQKLFKYNYLQATRLLNDEKTDTHYSISKEILHHFKQGEDWTEFKNKIIKDIMQAFKDSNLNDKVKKHSLEKAQKTLADIEKYFDYNRGEFSLQTNISDEILMEFLTSSLQTFFEFKNGVKLKEFSQGLGISNLIYMCLKVEAFAKQYEIDKINIFVIEEPEAHMHPQMERMLIKFINEILKNENDNRVQGIVTTHSNEIVKCSDLKQIRILRIDDLLVSSVYDMNKFQENLDSDEQRQFFSFLFSVNYSDLVFANKIIMYEGDTEKLYIEKLLLEKDFEELSNQYISFVQVGGAYSHWYRKLIHFLNIKTLIITDIDYNSKLVSIAKIKKDKNITNAGLVQYYRDYVIKQIYQTDILPYCESRCRCKDKDCIYNMSELKRLITLQSDLRKKPCRKINKPDYKKVSARPMIEDIYSWLKSDDYDLIKIATQGEDDHFTRTLEEAMICTLLNVDVDYQNTTTWWKEKIEEQKLMLDMPTKGKITVRDLIQENKNNKANFMYSVILANLQMDMLPNYIKEGLDWLKH